MMTSLFTAAELLSPLLYTFLLTFCRIGAAFMFFPGFSDSVPQQSRLLAALAVSLPVSLIVGAGLTIPAASDVFLAILSNLTVGLYLAISARLMLASCQMAGQIMGQTSGLYNPFNTSGLAFEGSTVLSSIMMLCGTALIFAADLHLHFIVAITSSFEVITLHGLPSVEMMNDGILEVVASSFRMAVTFAAPFLVFSMVFNIALGVCNKMMPSLAVYFVFSPVLICLGILLVILVFGTIAASFVDTMMLLIDNL